MSYIEKIGNNNLEFNMDNDPNTNNKPASAYDDFGSKFEIKSPANVLNITVPDGARRGVLSVNTAGGFKIFKSGETSGTNNFSSNVNDVEFKFFLTDSALPDLINVQRPIHIDGVSFTKTFREEIFGIFDALFDFKGDRGAADLEGTIDAEDMKYLLSLGSGIPKQFIDGADDEIRVPFFGEDNWRIKFVGPDSDGVYTTFEPAGVYTVVLERVTTTAVCGNAICESGESSSTCPADCGTVAATYCGDGACNGGETCSTCSTDCGTCKLPSPTPEGETQ
ncbi:MAG: hypothetical protein HYW50_02915 [Candidatus Diapherotrites archaeon]|nr:hypothetical protein [Candidatus Diapherotrites archaeon]